MLDFLSVRQADSPNIALKSDVLPDENDHAHLLPNIADSQKFARRQQDNGAEGLATDGAFADAKGETKIGAADSGKQGGGASCPVSKEYNALIEKAWRNAYDPSALGNLNSLKNKHNCEIKSPGDAIKYANQELAPLQDQYSMVLDSQQVKKLDALMSGTSKGMGFEFSVIAPEKAKTTGTLKVNDVIPGSPAAKAGLARGDYITKVDGVDLSTQKTEDVFEKIKADKTHSLTVVRDGKPLEFNLTPDKVNLPPVVDRMIPGTNIAYIRIRNFINENESYELQKAILRHKDADGYVFDVRGNPGGLVDQALQSASLIVGGGSLLSVKQRHEDDNPNGKPSYDLTNYNLDKYELEKRDILPNGQVKVQRDLRVNDIVDKPAVILVNEETASAAEIFAAAVQQNGDGELVGHKTFGKGIGQTVFRDQPAGSRVQVTNFRYYTPSGDWLGDADHNRIGLKPDQVVDNPAYAEPETENDKQYQAAIASINKQLGLRANLPPRR